CLTESAEFAALACLTTPTTGLYRFIAIWPGSFKVVFSAAAADFPDANPIADAFSTQWWSGQSTYAMAAPIVVAPPATISGVDASLTPTPIVTTPTTPTTATTTPATSAPAPAAVAVSAAKTTRKLKCKSGYAKRKVKGKLRCVKLKKPAPTA